MKNKRRILITGGTGSLGSVLTKKWATEGHQVTVVSRNPHRQAALSKEVPNATFILSDICNQSEMERACREQDILIHAAALKQVDVGEYHPVEYARVNIQGTITIASAWTATHPRNDGYVLGIGSDKGVSSLNAYGASKKLLESIFRKYKFSILRYGNVLGSRGSALQMWKIALAEHQPLLVRTPFPTRFLLTLNEAVALIEDALRLMETSEFKHEGGIFVPYNLVAFSIKELADYIAKQHGRGVVFESLLPYEKVHESLVADGEGPRQVSDKLCMIVPSWDEPERLMDQFRSNTAPRIGPEEVLRRVDWKL